MRHTFSECLVSHGFSELSPASLQGPCEGSIGWCDGEGGYEDMGWTLRRGVSMGNVGRLCLVVGSTTMETYGRWVSGV